MTAIKGYIGPNRRPGELGVHSVDRFHFFVPNLAVAQSFYGEFGLEVRERDGLLSLNTHGHAHSWGTVGEGPRKKFGHLSFGAFDEDIERFSERLQRAGIARLDPPAGVDSNGIWFRDPHGVLIEIKVAPKSSPDEKTHFGFVSVRCFAAPRHVRGRGGSLTCSCSRLMWPRRLLSTLAS
jgi:catechol 2,3-dioxygenase-like lactoylglutathione lyase family enzyme